MAEVAELLTYAEYPTSLDAPLDRNGGEGGESMLDLVADEHALDPLGQTLSHELDLLLQHGMEGLNDREREVLDLMAEGLTNRAIAKELFVSERGVERHVTSIFTKLDLPPSERDHRRVLAVLAYLRE